MGLIKFPKGDIEDILNEILISDKKKNLNCDENYICPDNLLCNVDENICVDRNYSLENNLSELFYDGKIIIGSKETIDKFIKQVEEKIEEIPIKKIEIPIRQNRTDEDEIIEIRDKKLKDSEEVQNYDKFFQKIRKNDFVRYIDNNNDITYGKIDEIDFKNKKIYLYKIVDKILDFSNVEEIPFISVKKDIYTEDELINTDILITNESPSYITKSYTTISPKYEKPASPKYQPPASPKYQPPASPKYQPPVSPKYDTISSTYIPKINVPRIKYDNLEEVLAELKSEDPIKIKNIDISNIPILKSLGLIGN